ncbi:hypothetical protein HMPREF1981_03602 [Bacteroides pyogenes F0041]|uniref:Uncharacterized protein n=1 Tax=Bacteroides pyogenes F0041 TaxID=1321819 RepID=U2C9W9_9BACE|nr:hypothetical protein HMPREF1981_03602 [Bacteroides pyogenes F0041]
MFHLHIVVDDIHQDCSCTEKDTCSAREVWVLSAMLGVLAVKKQTCSTFQFWQICRCWCSCNEKTNLFHLLSAVYLIFFEALALKEETRSTRTISSFSCKVNLKKAVR